MFDFIKLFLVFFFLTVFTAASFACESCGCSLSRPDQQSSDHSVFAEYMFEQQNWRQRDVHYAFGLGQDGHDTHDKTSEDYHHYLIGGRLTKQLLLTIELPYIVRRALKVDDEDHLGDHMRSEGWGDLQAIGEYDFIKDTRQSLGALTGVKFPTGSTKEEDVDGSQFEPEMQPGSGSYDYLWGGVYHGFLKRWEFSGNAVYTLKTTGAADFRFGNTFSTIANANYLINPQSRWAKIKPGAQINYIHEAHQVDHGVKVEDSGGETIFLGPILNLDFGKNATLFTSYQYPVLENPGGVHQKLNDTWSIGVKVGW
jgi:hypothetical protein